ncbi:MAG: YitT family protein [Clostridiales bacterium]|jgi:uncharacterized membrane-anchored protein YitT (DUF2179 family)|nr:YitT family protein [Clostridiales bacterium]
MKKILLLTLGDALLAFSIMHFLIPAKLATGGVSGLASVIYFVTGWQVGIMVFILNIPIFIAGWISYGKKFVVKSLYSTIMLSVFLTLFEFIPIIHYDALLSSVYGGAIGGLGMGISFLAGGTTGGTDIIAKILNKKTPNISIGNYVLLIDALIIAATCVAVSDLNAGLYSVIALFINAKVIDIVLQGTNFAKMAMIVTDKTEEIIANIHEKLQRGATKLQGKRTFSRRNTEVIFCTVGNNQVVKLKKLVTMIDENAFIAITDAREVVGRWNR